MMKCVRSPQADYVDKNLLSLKLDEHQQENAVILSKESMA